LFFGYVDICNNKYRHGDDLMFYRELIAQHRNIANLSELLVSDTFLQRLYSTLIKWDMNERRARLAEFSIMCDSIWFYKQELINLYKYRLDSLSDDDIQIVEQQLKLLFCGLHIMATKRRIVGVSKALHFLLPDLFLPIDGSNTMLAFYGYNRYESGEEKEFETFRKIFERSHEIGKRLNLTESDVNGCGWSCSVPKLIDNAIIGFFIKMKDSMKE